MKIIRIIKNQFFLATCLLLSINTVCQDNASMEMKEQANKISKVLSIINLSYVDTVDNNAITEAAIEAMLKSLDPHCAYMTPKVSKAATESLSGKFEGIGVQYQIVSDTIYIVAPIAGGPSDKVGVLAGDKIINIDGEPSVGKHINTDWVQKHLKGPKGTEVNVDILRQGEKDLLNITIERDEIPLYSVDVSYMVTDEIGYIKLNKFARTSLNEFNEALISLKGQGLTKLIVDLRNNPGGYLDIALAITDNFFPKDKLLVYNEGRVYKRRDFKSSDKGLFKDGEVVVLINEGSASGSEILAGAIQDWDRGRLIGRRTFGKGLVQRPFFLDDGSEVRLTIARYHTPSGRCIQKPYDDGAEKYYKDLIDRREHGELYNQDSISFPDSLKYTTSEGRVVFGGGGVMPDIFIPVDTTISDLYKKIITKGVMNRFVLKYVDENRDVLKKKYINEADYLDNFMISESILKEITDFAVSNGIKIDDINKDKSIVLIKAQIKALIGRSIYDQGIYYKVINAIEPEFLEAVKYLNN